MDKDIEVTKEKALVKRASPKSFLVRGLTIKGKKNITVQQSVYAMRTGKKLSKDLIAAMILETGTI